MKVLFLRDKFSYFKEEIEKMGHEVYFSKLEDSLKVNLPLDAQVLCLGLEYKSMHKDFLDNFKDLKYIFLDSVGIDYVDLSYIEKNNIILCNNHGAYSEPIGEWIVYNILQIQKENRNILENQRKKIWKRPDDHVGTLYNKKVLILGTGSIAHEAARRIKAFDMEISGYNTRGQGAEYFDFVYSKENLYKDLSKFDFIVSTLPGTPKTNKMIDDGFISKLKEGASIINISRGSIIDEEALYRNLKSKKLKAAAIDVANIEPLDKNSPLWDLENIYISPHMSDDAEDYNDRRMRGILYNLKALSENRDLINIVNFKKGY